MQARRLGALHLPFVLAVGILALVAGCHKDQNPVIIGSDPSPASSAALNAAAATGISNSLTAGNSGAVNQMGDMIELSHAFARGDFPGGMLDGHGGVQIDSVVRSYDSATGWWTITMFRERSHDQHLMEFQRTFQLQFLNGSGTPQKFWLVGTDTAHSIHFKIVSGSGIRMNRHGTDRLLSLSGDWMVTGANTNVFTINTVSGGDYMRVSTDTMSHDEKFRTSFSTLDLKFTDVMVPRDDDEISLSDGVSGTISGTFHAVVTFRQDSTTVTTTIDRTINITLGGGNAEFDLGGKIFSSDIEGGDFLEQGNQGDQGGHGD